MKPLSLHLENVRTFDTLDFDFPEGACAVVGPNGAGKSTLISALDVALFGAEGRSLADWLSRDRPEQTMVIELTFEHGGETYRVRRTFNGKGRGTSRVDFECWLEPESHEQGWMPLTRESAAATQVAIEQIIGLTRETFRASAFMAQGDGGAFCESTPGRRKEILASVLGLGIWDEYRERARADLRAAEQSLAVVRAKIEQSDIELSTMDQVRGDLAAAKFRETIAKGDLAEASSQLAKARERLSALRERSGLREAAEGAATGAQDALAGLLARLSALERQIGQAEERLMEREGLETLAEGLPGLERERDALAEQSQGYAEHQRARQERSRFALELSAARNLAEKLDERAADVLESIGSKRCDRCEQLLGAEAAGTAAASYHRDAADQRRIYGETEELATANLRVLDSTPSAPPDPDRVRQVADLIRLGQDAKAKLAALAQVETYKEAHEEELSKVRAELPEREAAAATARAELQALGPHDSGDIQVAQWELEQADTKNNAARVALDQTLQEIARLVERLERLDKLSKDKQTLSLESETFASEVQLLSHLERACGPNGVPALILETSAIPQMEAEWNRVLRLLPTESGDVFEVELHTQREKKTGDGAVDALDIVVYSGGQARPYSTYSGGEQMRISIAQRRALSSLLAHRKGADCPLMILDEPNSLDDQGMAALAQVLEDLAASEGLTILCVSHDPALRDAFENSIEIVKEGGRSRIAGTTEPAPTVQEVA